MQNVYSIMQYTDLAKALFPSKCHNSFMVHTNLISFMYLTKCGIGFADVYKTHKCRITNGLSVDRNSFMSHCTAFNETHHHTTFVCTSAVLDLIEMRREGQ